MASKQDIAGVLMALMFLPNCPVNEQNIEQVGAIYMLVLGDLTEAELKAAAAHYLSTERFFPTPGDLRSAAMELRGIELGIPSALEGWAQVQNAVHYFPGLACDEGARLWAACAGKADREYFRALRAQADHEASCNKCTRGGYREVYGHPLVEHTVRLFGGRDALMTDNPAADRRQFIDAYREVVDREIRKLSLLPDVRRYLERSAERASPLLADLVKKLTVDS